MSVAKLPRSNSRWTDSLARILPRTLRSLGAKWNFEANAKLDHLSTLLLAQDYARICEHHANPLNRCGRKIFSNSDEDGITLEIARRIGMVGGVFAEFGVGNGLENNTIALAAIGWKGFWVGGQKLAFSVETAAPGTQGDFAFFQEFVDRTNVLPLARQGLDTIAESELDLLSLDLDGNDFYFIEELLKGGLRPKIFLVEYNAKFPPPIRWKIDYDPQHRWSYDDYFGASLMEFCDLFERHGYFLVCCNSGSGANAWFVQSAYRNAFRDVPQDVNVLWSPPRYFQVKYGHPASPKTVVSIINNIGATRESRHSGAAASPETAISKSSSQV